MRILIHLIFLLSMYWQCTVIMNFVFATVEEETDFAGGIVIGTVTAVSN